MSYSDRLKAEINGELNALERRREPLVARWVTHAVCNAHTSALMQNEHSDFWTYCTYEMVRNEVRRCINKRAGDRPELREPELVFPGFEHVQRYYVVPRDGQEIGVPALEMTDAEVDAKAALYRTMGTACYAHADELDRFKAWRWKAVRDAK